MATIIECVDNYEFIIECDNIHMHTISVYNKINGKSMDNMSCNNMLLDEKDLLIKRLLKCCKYFLN